MTEPSREPKSSKLCHPIVVRLIVTVVGGLALSWVIGLIGPKSGGGSTVVEGGGEAEPPAAEEPQTERGSGPGTESTVVEWSDNTAGSPVFADPTGSPVKGKPSRIPYRHRSRRQLLRTERVHHEQRQRLLPHRERGMAG
jgi:hypothetical protein